MGSTWSMPHWPAAKILSLQTKQMSATPLAYSFWKRHKGNFSSYQSNRLFILLLSWSNQLSSKHWGQSEHLRSSGLWSWASTYIFCMPLTLLYLLISRELPVMYLGLSLTGRAHAGVCARTCVSQALWSVLHKDVPLDLAVRPSAGNEWWWSQTPRAWP